MTSREWTQQHPTANAEYTRRWREKNREYFQKWRQTNRGRVAAISANRKAAKLQATPAWLSETDGFLIISFYKEAQRLTNETGVRHEVDHIVPLLGDGVRGLHVPWNLQILTKDENMKKGKQFVS